MTEKKNGLGAGSIDIDGEKLATETFEFEGERFTVRELTIDEGDDILDAATDDKGKVNGRLNTRMLLAKALTDPVKTVEQVGKFGGRKYLTILRSFNKLNSLPIANPTLPAGSAEPTSPDGGEPLPTD